MEKPILFNTEMVQAILEAEKEGCVFLKEPNSKGELLTRK